MLEKRSTTVDLNIATLSSQIAEVRAMLEKEEQDNIELKRENSLLIDFASNLKKQVISFIICEKKLWTIKNICNQIRMLWKYYSYMFMHICIRTCIHMHTLYK